MKTITLKIRDKKIFPVFSGRLVAQNVKAYRFVLDPDAEWEGLALTATFEGPGGTKSVPLLCGALEEDIPWEPISAPGWLKISVTGLEETEGNILCRLQTKEMGEELEIFPNGALPGEESAEHTPEFEERVLALAQEAVVSAENVKLAAENGEFDGADGMSAYEVACTAGFKGTKEEWLESICGEVGPRGPQGEVGPQGDDYVLTDEDKDEIASSAASKICYAQDEEPPEDAPEGSLWVDMDEEGIGEVAVSVEGVPDYWQTHLDERVEDIRRAIEAAGRNKSSFFFYSDAHWSNEGTYTAKLSPALLKYLHKNTPINKTNYGGDIVSAESTDTETMAYLWDWRKQIRDLPNHHSVIGNHDDGNSTDRLLSKEYIYSYLLAPEESNDIVWGGDFYYYIDDKSESTRYLYLDVFYDSASPAQLEFTKEAIKSVPKDWHIVAICHSWFGVNYGTTDNPIYPPVLNGFASEMQDFLDTFDDYNAREGEYADCGGWVELCIGGHYHLDHYEHTAGGIPVIIVEADTFHDRGGTMPTHGNTGEASVNAVVVDYNSRVVKVIRVGRGSSYEVPINRVAPAIYTNVIPLSVDANGTPFNGGNGWCDNSRIGSGGIYAGTETGVAAQWVTGHIEIDPNVDNTFYLKNVTLDKTSTSTHHGIAFFDESFTRTTKDGTDNWDSITDIISNQAVYDGNNIIQFTYTASKIANKNVKYIAICCGGLSGASIITINEPLEV